MLLFARFRRPLRSFRDVLSHFLALLSERKHQRRRQRSRERRPALQIAAIEQLEQRALMSGTALELPNAADPSSVNGANATAGSTFDPPVAANDWYTADNTGQPLQLDVLQNDSGHNLRLQRVTQPAAGSVTIDDDHTSLVFTPASENKEETAHFSYSVIDSNGQTSTAAVRVKLSADGGEGAVIVQNQVPNANNDNVQSVSGQPALINVLANDSDPDGDDIRLTQIGTAAHGTTAWRADVSDLIDRLHQPADGIKPLFQRLHLAGDLAQFIRAAACLVHHIVDFTTDFMDAALHLPGSTEDVFERRTALADRAQLIFDGCGR